MTRKPQHHFQPDPDVRDYCLCGLHRDSDEHDQMSAYVAMKAQKDELLQREREVIERPLLAQIDSLRLENRGLTQQKAAFFAEFELLRNRAEKAEELLAACRMSREQEVESLRSRLASLRSAALKLPRPWIDGSIEFDEWIAAVDDVLKDVS